MTERDTFNDSDPLKLFLEDEAELSFSSCSEESNMDFCDVLEAEKNNLIENANKDTELQLILHESQNSQFFSDSNIINFNHPLMQNMNINMSSNFDTHFNSSIINPQFSDVISDANRHPSMERCYINNQAPNSFFCTSSNQMGQPFDNRYRINGERYLQIPGSNTLITKKTNVAHIKKPLNAFMLYMRDVRADVLKQVPHKDSTAINQMIGKMWQSLTKEQQSSYFDKAKEEREKHKQMYPEYNPRDYYALSLKRKRRKRDKNGHEPHPKKCRARFGIEQQDKWCKHCKRKKKCIRYMEGYQETEVELSDMNSFPNENNILNIYPGIT